MKRIAEAKDRRLLPLTLISENPTMELNPNHIFDGTSKAIDLSKMNVELRKLISLILLHYLYNNPQECLLIIEEAQNIITPRRIEEPPSIAEMIVAELRRHNVGVILIAHHYNDLPNAILNDAYAIVSLSKKSHPFRIEDEKLQNKSKLLFYENGSKVKALR
jgi:ABC-type uncharacterized transport system ATPase subunit